MDFLFRFSQINASMLNTADCIAIITVVPILDSVIYPAVDRWLGRKCRSTEKYMCGLLIGTLAIAAAAWLEVKRRHAPIVSACGGSASAAMASFLSLIKQSKRIQNDFTIVEILPGSAVTC